MANNDQNEFPLPVTSSQSNTRQTAEHLPRFFRTTKNKTFLQGTLDPLTQPGKLTRIDGYVGRKDIPNYTFDDNYLTATSMERTYYQLEPAVISENTVNGNVEWYADYIDYMNSLKYYGAPVDNHDRLNRQEAYAWNPHVDWDKLANFREYYWLPTGPDPVTIYGHLETTTSTFTITSQDEQDNIAYIFSPDGLTANPRLTLYRGIKYRFEINTPGKPFAIKTQPEPGPSYFYNIGVSAQRVEVGVVEFEIPFDAPSLLYYIDNKDLNTVGMIDIRNIEESAFLDIEAEILGKKSFTSSTGLDFINGLKIKFVGQVTPSKYATGFWYVEGVGSKIKLINFSDLETPAVYGPVVDVPFDYQPFDSLPFESASNYPLEKDYITINRAARDRNTWTRNNRWFHRNVLEATATANNQVADLNQKTRANRPIIEFEADVKLHNHGWVAKKDVDLIDSVTTDVFSTIEGQTGYNIDGVDLVPGQRVLFIADPDILVNGRIFEVKTVFLFEEGKINPFISRGRTQITLQEVFDTEPHEGEVVYAKNGNTYKGSPFYYQDGKWSQAQKKTKTNQFPLFDLFDEQLDSFSSMSKYPYNTFSGNRVFGYKIGTSQIDTELGFSVSHLNINNIGDIQFNFDLQTESWSYQEDNKTVITLNAYSGFLRKFEDNGSFRYSNGWIDADSKLQQPIKRVLKVDNVTNLIPIDVYDKSARIPIIKFSVFVNDQKRNDVSRRDINDTAYILFGTDLNVDDKVVYKVYSPAPKNLKGYYQIPLNWQNNPLNDVVSTFTFGEVIDHVRTITDSLSDFYGPFPGISNLSNVGLVSQFGRRFLQHAGSMPLASFVMVDKDANLIKSLRWTANQYSLFKKEFLRIATSNAFEGTASEIVDLILLKYTETKYIDTSPFYFSDMAPYGGSTNKEFIVNDPRLPYFVIDSVFDPNAQVKRMVLVYVNDEQLIRDIDYHFDLNEAFVIITAPLMIGDIVKIKDFETTDACYIPHTPSKLGLFPSYVPRKYIDDTYRTPVEVIQGHDGSIIRSYGDFRDELILELEKRFYNSRRVDYDSTIFDINSIFTGYFRRNAFSKDEINSVMLSDFLRWNARVDQDLNTNNFYIEEDSFTFNYNKSSAPNMNENLPGYWRGIYKYFFDTDRPHTCPWEIQGFTIKPMWWDDVYGIAPYTSENKILWDAIEAGLINDPTDTRINLLYARPGMSAYIPVDADGNLLSPLECNLPSEFSLINGLGSYGFGDGAPVETVWRRSSEYAFSVVSTLSLLRGSEYIAKMWDRFRVKKNIVGQIYWAPTNTRIQLANLVFPDSVIGNAISTGTFTCGLVNIIEEFVFTQRYSNLSNYHNRIKNLNVKLSYRLGGFTSKDQIKVLLDSRSPTATGTIFLPTENYKIYYNTSSPVSTVSYSGVIIEKLGATYIQWLSAKRYRRGEKVLFQGDIFVCIQDHISDSTATKNSVEQFQNDSAKWLRQAVALSGFRVKGYDKDRNYFPVMLPITTSTDPSMNVGGLTESFVMWEANKYYPKGVLAKVGNGYIRARIGHTSGSTYQSDIAKWVVISSLPLTGGVTVIRRSRFRDYPTKVPYNTIFKDVQSVVDFLLGYQKALEAMGFMFDEYNKELDSPMNWLTSAREFMFWSLQKWASGAIITLSPSADLVKFQSKLTATVDNFYEDAYDYSIFKADGSPIKPNLNSISRTSNGFTMTPVNQTNDGIYHVRSNLVYKEHVLIFDNVSVFNDIIYDIVPGYRQGRVKLLGFKTSGWNGGFTSPGFVYDNAEVTDWVPNTDYNLGDMVNYQGYYFTAVSPILGKLNFDYTDWKQLSKAPAPGLIPNFDYKIEQFRDFYNLDSSNVNQTQQKLARHYIGYQQRPYLNDIINDDVAQYKFYQGFIKEKGTPNSISKLFDALRSSGFSSVDVTEEWAFKLGDYGSSDTLLEIEIPLDEEEFRYNPQNIMLTQQPDRSNLTVFNVTPYMVSVKPSSYDSNPFSKIKLDHLQNNYGVFKYMVAGYVKDEDVNHIIYNEAALMNYDVTMLQENDKIWLGYTSTDDWDVYEFVKSKTLVTNWSASGNTLTLDCNISPDVVKDQIVVISNLGVVDGFYKVQRVYGSSIELFTFNTALYNVDTDSTHGVVFKLESSRFSTLSSVSAKRYNTSYIRGQTIWVDSDQQKRWLVLKNQDAFTKSELQPITEVINQHYGYEVKISGNGTRMFVTSLYDTGGKVFVYSRPNNISKWSFIQKLSVPDTMFNPSNSERFGTSVDVNFSGSMLVITAPYLSNLHSHYVGAHNPSSSYYIGDIVKRNERLWKSKNGVGTFNATNWQEVYIFSGVDKFSGHSSTLSNQGVVIVYKFDSNNNRYKLEIVLGSYDPLANEKFGTKVKLSEDGVNTWLFVSSQHYDNDKGRVQVFKKETDTWRFNTQRYLDFSNVLGSFPSGSVNPFTQTGMYGFDIDCTPGAAKIVVSAPLLNAGASINVGAVFIYGRSDNDFNLLEVIDKNTLLNGIIPNLVGGDSYLSPYDLFGFSVSISNQGLYVSCPNDDNGGTNSGSIYVFVGDSTDSSNNVYRLTQLIYPPSTIDNERFGTKIKISPDGKVLLSSAVGGDSVMTVTFDVYSQRVADNSYVLDSNSQTEMTPTTFDKGGTIFSTRVPYTGSVYVYNKFDDEFIYGDKLMPTDGLSADDNFGASMDIIAGNIAIGTPNRFIKNKRVGTVFSFTYSDLSWSISSSEDSVVDISKFKRAFIYNTETNKLIENLDFIDPAKGRIPAVVDQEIKYQTFYDPAIYEYGFDTEVSVDRSAPWTDEHVGEVWWNLRTVKYTWYEQGDVNYRSSNWGRIFPGCSIDVYEWVESPYLPSKWATLADTEEGLASGISGIPKDIDDFTYSSRFKYDVVSGTKKVIYYYWVKNKRTTPTNPNRKMSCANITQMLLDPKSQGYHFIAITDKNTISLSNVGTSLIHTDVSLNVETYLIENQDLLTHRQYALIAEKDPLAIIPPTLEQKWFDSLIGKDVRDNLVPDNRLGTRQRYGNSNSPRQSWFINKFEALKQLVEYVNSILIKYQVVDNVNFSNLLAKQPTPTIKSGEVDEVIDILEELKYVGTVRLSTAKISVTVVNGQITGYFIDNSGYGYGRNRPYTVDDYGTAKSWYGPKVKIIGNGTGAVIQTVIDSQGRITNETIIIKPGKDYDTTTVVLVRDYSILVKSDIEANGGWSIQTWNSSKKNWSRSKTQSFDVSRYWDYADWYIDPIYADSTDIAFEIDRTVNLNGIVAVIGDIVKVMNVGTGGWLLLERFAITNSPDFTDDYRVVGKQNATIQISDKVYNLNQDLGYDIKFSYDTSLYDQNPSKELRYILTALRDDILIDDLRIEYINTFFSSVYYALSEQLYTDWLFKSSFLKINHNVGTLKKKITFQTDILESYQAFIEEAKPYKSKIREFVSSYEVVDPSNSLISDFDLPPYYNIERGRIDVVTEIDPQVQSYPWKNWADNYGYEIVDIVVKNQGKNYISIPKVIISGGDGTGASAIAHVSRGQVYSIEITDHGMGYKSAPNIYISGGNGDVDEDRAEVYAIIGNSNVRINTVKMKLDRYTTGYTVSNYRYLDTFTGTGKHKFKLTYAPEIEKHKFRILVDEIEIYGAQYNVSITETLHDTYTALEGYVIFVEPPVEGSNITIAYDKNIRLYSAADRIGYAYAPADGQYGKYLGQLMTGIDYGGVSLTSIAFEIGSGWDVLPWDVTSWDSILTSNDDYAVSIDGSTRSFELPYTPKVGEVVNTYIDNTRVDDLYYGLYDGSTVKPNGRTTALPDAIMKSFIGDGVHRVITLPDILPESLHFIGSVVTFRRSTSDGTVLPTDRGAIDSLISGGDLSYSTALGITADDIVVDGDRLITPDTSHGPEELVQGQVVDTLSINVYHAPAPGGPNVTVENYVGDGSTSSFPLAYKPDTVDGIIVLANNRIYDFEVDYVNQRIVLTDVPPVNSFISITVMDTAGYDILDKESFNGDGSTREFLTAARYATDEISVFATINGKEQSATIKASDDSYEAVNNVLVIFDQAPLANDYVQIMVLSGNIQKYSKITTQHIDMVPTQYVYDLTNPPLVKGPLSATVLVLVDNEFLRAPDYKNFVYSGESLVIDDFRYTQNSLTVNDIVVYCNGVALTPIRDYTIDLSIPEVKLSPIFNVVDGDQITIEILKNNDFIIQGSQLILTNRYNIVNKNKMQITTFTNHDIDKILRTSTGFVFDIGYDTSRFEFARYDVTLGAINSSGILKLPRTVSNKSGVFVNLNRKLLEPNVDYVVMDDLSNIMVTLPDNLQSNSFVEIITTNAETTRPTFGFKVFKDMLNRFHYKRLDNARTTKLNRDLPQFDTVIYVSDASVLEDPNPALNLPGVIEILNERIEYFVKDGDTLKQLRRGTLGTSVNEFVLAGTNVSTVGKTETIPYSDTENKRTYIGDGSTMVFELDYVPQPQMGTIDDGSTEYNGWYREVVETNVIAGNFVIGTRYEIVTIGTTDFRSVGATSNTVGTKFYATAIGTGNGTAVHKEYMSIPEFYGQNDELEIFVADRRLNKAPITIFDDTTAQDSFNDDGNVTFEAEFSVDGTSKSVRLTNPPAAGDFVVIISRRGRTWQPISEDSSLVFSETVIGKFLTEKKVDLPK